MKSSVSSILKIALEIVWRRRYLLMVPMLIALPLSVTAAKYIPKTYQATALMLMQEDDSLFSTDQRSNEVIASQLRVKVAGLEALLKSERVLSPVIDDTMGDKAPTDPRLREIEMQALATALQLELVGADFLEFRLKSTNPQGLGTQLQAVTTRFLEALLVPGDETMSAPRMVLEHSRRELTRARADYAELADRLDVDPEVAVRARRDERNGLTAQLEVIGRELRKTEAREAEVRRLLGELEAQTHSQSIQPIGEARASGPNGVAKVSTLQVELRETEARVATLRESMKEATSRIVAIDETLETLEAVSAERNRLQQRLRIAQTRAERFELRFSDNAGAESLSILKAPERIKIIDPPTDPKVPLISGLKFFLATLMAGILLGFGLAALSEIFDQSIRRPEDLETATGLPVLARLPKDDALVAA